MRRRRIAPGLASTLIELPDSSRVPVALRTWHFFQGTNLALVMLYSIPRQSEQSFEFLDVIHRFEEFCLMRCSEAVSSKGCS